MLMINGDFQLTINFGVLTSVYIVGSNDNTFHNNQVKKICRSLYHGQYFHFGKVL